MNEKIATKPHLVESKNGWYIYLSVRDPRTGKFVPKKVEKGFIACKTIKEKRLLADKLIKEYTSKLKNGWVRSTRKTLCLGVNFRHPEEEKFQICNPVNFRSKKFQFSVE